MVNLLVRLWRSLGSIRLTVTICFLLAVDLGLGYFSLRENLEIFAPMSDVGLSEWLVTYGAANRGYVMWFFVMLALLAALAINTFACTSERVMRILAQRHPWRELPFRLAPHLMHYAVLIILTGYLCSYLFSVSETGRALRPGERFELPDIRTTVRYLSFAPELLQSRRVEAFDGYVIRPNARLMISRDGQEYMATLNFIEPVHIDGYSIYLSDFHPRKPGSSMNLSYINLIVRHDPSNVVYRFGMAVFILGLGLYVFERKFRK